MAGQVLLGARSPLATVFLLHIALEIPFAIQGVFSPLNLPFLDMTNTTVVVVKLFSALNFAGCIAALLVFSLPEMLPGKRAMGLMFLVYHAICSYVLLSAPRFIPHSGGALMESLKLTPENCWAIGHGLLSTFFAIWWQATLPHAQAMANTTKRR